ncbi:hypothetical protein AHF37_05522 [Paragonimus kellicotti]|nr:hypothetical protein AHF37_05522 [Paragonimus kellicotti]
MCVMNLGMFTVFFFLISSVYVNSQAPSGNETTTVSPAPLIPLYYVKNGTNVCLLVQMNVKLDIPYFNKQGVQQRSLFYINSTTTSLNLSFTGTCGTTSQSLKLWWWPSGSTVSWNLSFEFKNLSSGHFRLELVEFNYTLPERLFPDTNDTSMHRVYRNASYFTCPLGRYFKCMAKQTNALTKVPSVPDTVIQPEVYLTISNQKVEAFRFSEALDFVGSAYECSADYVPNKIVPIVVGVALGCMIIVALITFIIGSRRRQAGYHEL